MKSERRHELQTNVLSHKLAVWIEVMKPHTSKMIAGLVAIVVLIVVYAIFSSNSQAKRQESWSDYATKMTSRPSSLADRMESLESVAKAYPDSAAGQWASLAYANTAMADVSQQYFSKGPKMAKLVEKIESVYSELARNASDSSLRNQAKLGLARVLEMQGKLEESLKQYNQVSGILEKTAQDRVKELSKPDSAETLKWLADAKMIIPTVPSGPGVPGLRPGFNTEFSPTPQSGSPFQKALDDALGTSKSGTSESPFSLFPSDTPAEGAGSSDASKPVETPSAEKTPTEKTAPAEEAPSKTDSDK